MLNFFNRLVKRINIKSTVQLFFAVNLALVAATYFITDYYDDIVQEDLKYVDISQENEKLIERISFIASSIVEGRNEALKDDLKKNIEIYSANIEALKEGNGAEATVGDESIKIYDEPKVEKYKLREMENSWNDLKKDLDIIIKNKIEIQSDTSFSGLEEVEDLKPNIEVDSLKAPSDSLQSTPDSPEGELVGTTEEVQDFPELLSYAIILNPDVERAYVQAETKLEELLAKNKSLTKNEYEKKLDDSQESLQDIIFVTFLGNTLLLSIGFFVIGTFLTNPLKKIADTAREVASGNVEAKVPRLREDEIGEVADSLNLIVNSFKQYTDFAEDVGKGNFDANFEVKSKKDTLGFTLLKMRDSLKTVAEEDKKRNWANEGFTLFSSILRETSKGMEELSYLIVSNLVKYVNANQGGMFLLTEDKKGKKYLDMQAAFAYNKRKYEQKRIELGQGLLGQAAMEKSIIYLNKVPENYISITSGLGSASPKHILMIPLIANSDMYGAIELASFKPYEKYVITFLEQLSESIASTVATVKIGENTRKLLSESQERAEEMKAQEEEMRQNMEELSSTQEVMEKNQRELESYKTTLEDEVEARTAELSQKENQLSRALSQLQGIIDSSKAGIVAVNHDNTIVAINQRCQELIEQLRNHQLNVGDKWFDSIEDKSILARAKDSWARAFDGEYHVTEQKYIDTKQDIRWLEFSYSPIYDDEEIIGVSMFLRDITRRKRNQKSTEFTANILDNSTNEVYVFDAQTLNFTQVNERARRNLGYTMAELKELTPYELEPRFDRVSFEKYIEPLREKEVENLLVETEFIRKDTTRYGVELNIQYFEDEETPLFAAIVQDISVRREYEAQLQEALQRFDLASKATKEGLWEMQVKPEDPINPDNPAWWSSQFKALLGFEEEEFEEKLNSWASRLHPDDRERVLRAFYEHLIDRTGETPYNLEYRLLTKAGEYEWFSSLGETLRDEEGLPRIMAGSLRNIARRKKVEQNLKEQTSILNAIVESAENSIIPIDSQGNILSANKATERIFQYNATELIGKSISILLAEEYKEAYSGDIDKLPTDGTTQNIQGKKRNLTTFPLEIAFIEAKIDLGKIYVGILRDMSQKKENKKD